MRYMVLVYGDAEAFAKLPPEQARQMIEALQPFEETVSREGKLLATHRLTPASKSTLVRIRDGEAFLIDGPFTETKEQLGGYYLVEARDKAQVLKWLELIPPLMDSTFEVRQVIDEERSLP